MRLEKLPAAQAERYAILECPSFDTTPWIQGAPLCDRRVAIVSSAGLVVRGERPFRGREADYRVIPGETREEAGVQPPAGHRSGHGNLRADRRHGVAGDCRVDERVGGVGGGRAGACRQLHQRGRAAGCEQRNRGDSRAGTASHLISFRPSVWRRESSCRRRRD